MAEGPEEARGRPPGQDDGGGNQESVPSLRGLPAAAAAAAPLSRDCPQAEPQALGRPPALGLAAAVEESEPPREPENRGEAASGSDSGSSAGLQEPASCEAPAARAPHLQPPVRAAAATRVGPAAASRAPSDTGRQAGREYVIPSLAHRFMAEMVDFFILFFIKATIVLSIMHLSGIKDISKFAMHYIIEEIDEDTSMEDLQKMMVVALIYRLLVCFYEIICIWGAGGATPGKFLLGLRVVTCDTSVLIAPSRVLVIPSSNVSITTSAIRALIKNFSIASFFPAFITLLFFQHNRTAYDIVAGTIVVKRNGVR
ncbi:PREDICTED: protein FAM8A1 [Bison bison bison]|uniref:Protein FAM8A1 n=1 Tax=Bison bison bison TaxID=43346 RepID=A0A6P3HX48_BISBB|nr:PREDICTED: protein FAM8A1 [Bison bison bison]